MRTDVQAQVPESASVDPDWAWARYAPSDAQPWTIQLAGHLYRRAGFGANFDELQRATNDGAQRVVDRLIDFDADVPESYSAIQRDEQAAARSGSIESLSAWWLRRMVETPFPLLEKMTLFWHSHFGIRAAEVKDASLMLEHVQRLRSFALGKYPELLGGLASDPAVFLGLGAQASRKNQPNEQFARQLMQRLSVGAGNFGEEDVREASRAFTGWFVLRGKLRYFDREHDAGAKNILGHAGNWKLEDVVRIVLEHPVSANTLAVKLFRWFVSEVDEPSEALLAPLVECSADDYDIGRAVEMILRSNLFYSTAAYRRRIKSPVDFGVCIARALEGNVSTTHLAADISSLGQGLYNPPTIEGWHGGRHWINTATMVQRMNLASALLALGGRYGGKLDPNVIVSRYDAKDSAAAAKLIVDTLLQSDWPEEQREVLWRAVPSSDIADPSWLRSFTTSVLQSPVFQLS